MYHGKQKQPTPTKHPHTMNTALIIAALTYTASPLPPAGTTTEQPTHPQLNTAREQSLAAQEQILSAMNELRNTLSGINNKHSADTAAPAVAASVQQLINAATETRKLAKQHPGLSDGIIKSDIIDNKTLSELAQNSLGQLIDIYINKACYESEPLLNATKPLLQFLISEHNKQSNSTPQSNTPPSPELQNYIRLTREFENSVKQLISQLETINNRTSADAAAPGIITCAQQLQTLNNSMNALPGPADTLSEPEKDILRSVMYQAETAIIAPLTQAVGRIKKNNYYNSPQLKQALEQWLKIGGRLCRSTQ